MAHNAAFDINMLQAHVRRLAASYQKLGKTGKELPFLTRDTGIQTSVDTLQMMKTNKLWRSSRTYSSALPRPSSFGLSNVYSHILKKPMKTAHNAVGDILGLEEILMSPTLNCWKSIANQIQEPLTLVVDASEQN
eukprot:15335536-Ditylum_brightwellii.AAC.1